MNIKASINKFYQAAKKAVGEAVVGNDFARADGTVDGVVVGAAAGAVAGGAVGTMKGFYDQSADRVTETSITRTISEPELKGHHYYVRSDWSRRCFGSGEFRRCERELSGWWHTYSPNITSRVIRTYEEPSLQHSNHGSALGSALAGVAIGASIGAVLGLATGVVGKAVGSHPLERKPIPPDMRKELIDDAGETILKHTAIGAGAGAALGFGSGLLESSSALKLEQQWLRPQMTSKSLGTIPRAHYEWNGGGWDWGRPGQYRDHSPSGTTSVVRQAPILDQWGTPQMETVIKTLDSQRFGVISGVLGGTVLGAGMGFATGVTSSIINRMLAQAPPEA